MGRDATRLAVGDWVFCDPLIRSRDDALNPDMILTLVGRSLHDPFKVLYVWTVNHLPDVEKARQVVNQA